EFLLNSPQTSTRNIRFELLWKKVSSLVKPAISSSTGFAFILVWLLLICSSPYESIIAWFVGEKVQQYSILDAGASECKRGLGFNCDLSNLPTGPITYIKAHVRVYLVE
nr:hypothetical protein [Tanacetum cinerariifolium]